MPGGGAHPDDAALFAAALGPTLRAAAAELRWLRDRGYALPGALKLVGDRHQLRDRQRQAIARATSESAGAAARAAARAVLGAPPPPALEVDGLNVVITVETALRGGVLVTTVDGGLRDLAGVHGTYRPGPTTDDALAAIADHLAGLGWGAVPARFCLDAPVSNTGRLADRLRAAAAARGLPWTAEVVQDADAAVQEGPPGAVVASGDAPVLDRAVAGGRAWLDLGAAVVRGQVPGAWIVEVA